MSISSQAALTHLRSIKPHDGWSVQKEDEGTGLRLLRRNVPLSDTFFRDIHYCPDLDCVVGLLTSDASTCQVLVDDRGKPEMGIRVVSVSSYDPKSAAKNLNFSKSRSAAAADDVDAAHASGVKASRPSMARSGQQRQQQSQQQSTADPILPQLSPQQNEDLIKYALLVIGALIVLKILSNAATLSGLYLLALPLLYFYAVQTCPSVASFDAKKELKRVLRGQHLPDNHPQKPKGYWEELAARVTASVTAEIATFPGYEVEMTNVGGAAWLADVRVPTARTQCYWVGAFHRWYYVTSFEIPETPRNRS